MDLRRFIRQTLIESYSKTSDEHTCPVCGEKYVTQSKDLTTHNHTIEDLNKGHGKMCKNGHKWTNDTPNGKTIHIDTGIKLDDHGRKLKPGNVSEFFNDYDRDPDFYKIPDKNEKLEIPDDLRSDWRDATRS